MRCAANAAGIPGIQVDGNDLVAMRQIALEAIERARAGGGPTLIEAVSYRLADHTTADDASRYRNAEEVAEAWRREPIGRLRNYLVGIEAWSKSDEETLIKHCAERVQEATQAYLAHPPPTRSQMFDHLHASLPAALAPQRAQALAGGTADAAGHAG